MKEELQEALFRDFPKLYRERRDARKTAMVFGFCVGDGWEPAIRSLSQQLEQLISALPEEEQADYWCFQVKEKFGGLRFYMSASTDQMNALVAETESSVENICEHCGGTSDPNLRSKGVTCGACYSSWQNQCIAEVRAKKKKK